MAYGNPVSTGLLIFPSDSGNLKKLQIQGMSMYILSTVLSQLVMTLRGSRFPGGLGAMLIEILPFLRGIASDLQNSLGDESPKLIPTVMVAYALTSFLIGAVFILLGTLKAGRLVAYFPKTVLTGVIGGIGVSLFILGLELPLPPSSPGLTLSSSGAVLFGAEHLALLCASCVPAFLLSFSIRSDLLRRSSFGLTRHPYYIPLYFVVIPIVFWIVIAIMRKTDQQGRAMLVTSGWLFQIENPGEGQYGPGPSWIYWHLFDFNNVEIQALKSAIANIVLVVIIGVLNLPIYVPALGYSLRVPVNMNYEFIGQGVANLLAGLAGTVPNVLQLSYSLFFTRAGGGRIEAAVVTCLTLGFLFISSIVLPYVPTVLASTLVLFLGIELIMEAVWESTKSLPLAEWVVVMTTLIACIFLGYAPGFGVGVAAAALIYLLFGVVDTRARLTSLDEEAGLLETASSRPEHGTTGKTSASSSSVDREPGPLSTTDSLKSNEHRRETDGRAPRASHVPQELESPKRPNHCVIRLAGYIFFATIPSLEHTFNLMQRASIRYDIIILDMTRVCRIETAAAEFLERTFQEITGSHLLILAGVPEKSAVHADLQRSGLPIDFEPPHLTRLSRDIVPSHAIAFESLAQAVQWISFPAQIAPDTGFRSKEDAIEALNRLRTADALLQTLLPSTIDVGVTNRSVGSSTLLEMVASAGGQVRRYECGHLITVQDACIIYIIQGGISVPIDKDKPVESARPSLRALVQSCVRRLYSIMGPVYSRFLRAEQSPNLAIKRSFGPGQSIAVVQARCKDLPAGAVPPSHTDQLKVSSDQACWTLEIRKNSTSLVDGASGTGLQVSMFELHAVMDKFIISQDVTNMLPKMQVVVMAAYNVDNTGENASVTKFCQDAASATLAELSAYPNAQSHPRIALYRDTLKAACNLSAKKFPQSHESLYKRLLKEQGPLRPINPLVDFYNAISIKRGVTAGAFDLGELQTRSTAPLELRLSSSSTPGDTFRALDAGEGAPAAAVPPGELVYAQGTTVLTRQLAWRQAAEGLVTAATRNVIFVSEVFHGGEQEGATGVTPSGLSASVAEDFADGLKRFFGVEAQATVLGKGAGVSSVSVENAFS
ncbi:MAG: hypothetical protein Q9210_001189 [Variospora velana]